MTKKGRARQGVPSAALEHKKPRSQLSESAVGPARELSARTRVFCQLFGCYLGVRTSVSSMALGSLALDSLRVLVSSHRTSSSVVCEKSSYHWPTA